MTSAVDPTLIDTLKNTPFPYDTLFGDDSLGDNTVDGGGGSTVDGGGSGGSDTSSAPTKQIDDTNGGSLQGGG